MFYSEKRDYRLILVRDRNIYFFANTTFVKIRVNVFFNSDHLDSLFVNEVRTLELSDV